MFANTYKYNLAPEGERDVVPLRTILHSLKFMAEKIRNGSLQEIEIIECQLKVCGYDWIGWDSDKWQVMKALAVAVNEAIQEKIEPLKPVNDTMMVLNDKLCPLLEIGCLRDYFPPVSFSDDQP